MSRAAHRIIPLKNSSHVPQGELRLSLSLLHQRCVRGLQWQQQQLFHVHSDIALQSSGSLLISFSNPCPLNDLRCQGLQGQNRTCRKEIPTEAGCMRDTPKASQRVGFDACMPRTDGTSQKQESSDLIREARSIPSVPSSCRHCTNTKHIIQGSLLTALMIPSENKPTILAMSLDTSCVQGHHNPSTAMVHTKTQTNLRREFKGTKIIFQQQLKKKQRYRGTTAKFMKSRWIHI